MLEEVQYIRPGWYLLAIGFFGDFYVQRMYVQSKPCLCSGCSVFSLAWARSLGDGFVLQYFWRNLALILQSMCGKYPSSMLCCPPQAEISFRSLDGMVQRCGLPV